jgi:hypothetical protein
LFEISGIGTTKASSKKLMMECPALPGPKRDKTSALFGVCLKADTPKSYRHFQKGIALAKMKKPLAFRKGLFLFKTFGDF